MKNIAKNLLNSFQLSKKYNELKKIVHFGKYYFPDVGGIESVTKSLAEGAAKNNYSVSVVCFNRVKSVDMYTLNEVTIYKYPIWKTVLSQPLSLFYFRRCVKNAWQSDIVHLHAPNLLASICILFLKPSVKLVVHWHSDIINKGLLSYFVLPLEKYLLSRADNVITTSVKYSQSSSRLRNYISKLKIVPIGFTNKFYNNPDIQFINRLNSIIGKRKVILSVGRLVNYKGFEYLVNSAKYLDNDIIVIIVGDGPLKSKLKYQIEKISLDEKVILLGKLSDSELKFLYKKASIFCLSSINRAEAFGVVLLEAMSYGLPIVATDIPGSGVSWVNLHGVTGINVQVENPFELSKACNLILGSKTLIEKYSNAGKKRLVDEFSEIQSLNKVLEIYNSK